MKKLAKLVSALLVLAMMMGLMTACGGGDKPSNSPDPGTQSEQPSGTPSEKPETKYLRVSTGPSGGFMYTMFAGIADLMGKNYPGYYEFQLDVSTGSSENARNVILGEAAFSMFGLDIAEDAYNAVGEFEGMEAHQIAHIMSGPTAIVHIMVPADSPVKTVADLVGKKVGVGKGVMAEYLPNIFEAMGLPTDTTEMTPLTITDMCNALADKTMDAALYATPYPTAAISDLSMTSGLKLIPIDDATADKIIEASPYFYKTTIPAGVYKDVDYDTPTIARRSALMARPDMDEEFVYNMVKTIAENNEELRGYHEQAGDLNLDNALDGLCVPLHPGAERYYKEVGIIK